MLIEFTVGNFLSFKDRKTLSLEAAPIREHAATNVSAQGRYDLLTGAVLYGANAGGKSNLIKAMSTMKRLVTQSMKASSEDELGITPFLLHSQTADEPTFFEVLFLIDKVRYRYGFEVNNSSVKAEWLFEAKKRAEKFLFIRNEAGIEISSSFAEGKNLEEKTRDNALFLSVIDQFNGAISKQIMHWFSKFITITGLSHEDYRKTTLRMLEAEGTKQQLLAFYKKLDLGFEGIELEEKPINLDDFRLVLNENALKEILQKVEGRTAVEIKTVHKVFDSQNQAVGLRSFDLKKQESSGTNKAINISGALFSALTQGGVLVIDELDASLHPLMTMAITKLFNSEESHKNNAQLIIATHDTNLFAYGQYRRDQIYFVEKDDFGASDLYSLVEYIEQDGQKVRKDRSFEKDYIQGRYGAIPYIGNLLDALK